MKKALVFGITILFAVLTYSQEVDNVHFERDGKVIRIYYDIIGATAGSRFDAILFVTANDGNYNKEILTDKNVKAGVNKKIVWHIADDFDDLNLNNIKFNVELNDVKRKPKMYVGAKTGFIVPYTSYMGYGYFLFNYGIDYTIFFKSRIGSRISIDYIHKLNNKESSEVKFFLENYDHKSIDVLPINLSLIYKIPDRKYYGYIGAGISTIISKEKIEYKYVDGNFHENIYGNRDVTNIGFNLIAGVCFKYFFLEDSFTYSGFIKRKELGGLNFSLGFRFKIN